MNIRELKEVPVSSVVVTKLQIRRFYDQGKMRELVKSINEEGVMQSIVVRPFRGKKYELVFGSRRLKAARRSRQKNILAIVISNISDSDAIIMALNENLHRQDLEPFEEARAILRLIKEFGMGIQEVAKEIGRNSHFIKSRLKLLKMPKEVQVLVAKKRLPAGHVDILASLPVAQQKLIAQEATDHRLSHRELQVHIQDITGAIPRVRRDAIGWTSEKLQLRIKDFTRFLRSTKPIIMEMSPLDILNIRVVLGKLSEESEALIKELKRYARV